MPTLWGKFSSKDAKKKTVKENFIDTLHRFISPAEHKEGSRRIKQHSSHAISEKNCRSSSKSQSTSPSSQVSRCQSFAGRPNALPLPLPDIKSGITRTPSEVHNPRPILEKRGKPPLCLPLPKPHRIPKGLDDFDGELATASASSNCSIDSDDRCDSQLQSPVGNDLENSNKTIVVNHFSLLQKDQFSARKKCPREITKPTNFIFGNQTSSPMWGVPNSCRSNLQISHNSAIGSAPDSSMSSPSRSPMRVLCPDLVPISSYLPTKTVNDVTFNGSGQCSSPGSGQTSGHNSVGVDMLGQFWQHSRGSPECSPIPSPRMTSPGPSSRIHSGTVSPLHPRAGGTAPESPTGRNDDGKKQRHRLPLPPINVSRNSPFSPSNSAVTTPIARSPGKTENPTSPGSRWKKGKLIGCGTFGHVYAGFNSESGEMCAMKEVTLFMDDAKSKESAKHLGQEISLLSRLQHPNIVQYYGSEMIDDKLYIYLEYVSGGSIHKLLQDYGQFGEPAIRSYTQQILSGLAYLHAKNTVHRDIKGANILVDPNGRVKLADFGMAKHCHICSDKAMFSKYTPISGRKLYMGNCLPQNLWGEAILSANHILNKIPHKKSDKTPYELWKGREPSYKYLKVWGCLAKVEVPKPKQVKIGPKTFDAVFVGYAHNSSAYRFLVHKSDIPDIHVGTTIESRNAIFFENVFPNKKGNVESDNNGSSNGNDVTELSCYKRTIDDQSEEPRRSKRARVEKSFGPDFMTFMSEMDPRTLSEALSSPDAPMWKEAVNSEIESIMNNHTWELVDLPSGENVQLK
ncbi:mitogen-activated protein kinase kinase kinase YODA-like [Curcuma longa]|uniref:mitogen-activated protein kinase kinase kinase YODA-like n=1 Tax=Curcuma longa TaxID=136217 RepID=UPI003D9F991E